MLPERFDLTYIDENGQPQRPIAIHRAIYGSLERFIGILVEHFAGAFPLWLAPVQAVVIPIADRHVEAAEELAGVLRARGLRVEVDASDNRMQNKIRLAQEQKVPYMLVLGDREVEARTVAPRARNAARGEQQEAVAWDDAGRSPGGGGARARHRELTGDRDRAGPGASIVASERPVLSSRFGRNRVVVSRAPVRIGTSYNEGEQTISRDLRVNQMIRIPQVRVVDEEGAQLGCHAHATGARDGAGTRPRPRRGRTDGRAPGRQVPRLRTVQVRPDEAREGSQAQAALGDLQGSPPLAEDRRRATSTRRSIARSSSSRTAIGSR